MINLNKALKPKTKKQVEERMNMFENLFKTAIRIAVLPVNVLKDVVTSPVNAYEDKGPFPSTSEAVEKIVKDFNKGLE